MDINIENLDELQKELKDTNYILNKISLSLDELIREIRIKNTEEK